MQTDVCGTLVPYNGENTPEYEAIKQNCDKLTSVFAKEQHTVVRKLHQAGLYSSLHLRSGNPMENAQEMVATVEQHIVDEAESFYRFLGVLLKWKGNKEIKLLQDIHQTFVSKFINSQIN